MRETAFQARDHAETIGHAAVLTDRTAMDDLVRRLQDGDPAKGWEGDSRLCIAFNKVTQSWELWRFENDSQYRRVLRSKPGMAFPQNLIEHLVSIDAQRGHDAQVEIAVAKAKAEAAEDYRFSQAMQPKIEKLAWALRQDDKTGAGIA